MKNNIRQLAGFSSIILDFTRLLSAVIVVAGHCRQILNPNLPLRGGVFDFGHGAVIVFFVLSGYVIAHTTSVKKRTLNEYLVARFSRLYSICFPALVITAICAWCAFTLNKNFYLNYDRGSNVLRYLLTLFFCNELWFFSTAPPMNGPFWSLSFEFWYYILFACIYYKLKNRKGVLLIIVVSVFAGPKIFIMFPIWCLGWLAYKMKPLNISILSARLLAFVSLLTGIIMIKVFQDYPFKTGVQPFYMANAFISDTVASVFIALAFWLLPTNNEAKLRDTNVVKKFRFLANLTYPIYLFHFPILVVCKIILLNAALNDRQAYFAGLLITLVICIPAGALFDSLRYKWIKFFNWIFINKKELQET